MTGTARLNGLSRVLVRVRGRFGEDWANWSRVAEVMCLPPESGDGQTGQQNVEEDDDEESTAPLTPGSCTKDRWDTTQGPGPP